MYSFAFKLILYPFPRFLVVPFADLNSSDEGMMNRINLAEPTGNIRYFVLALNVHNRFIFLPECFRYFFTINLHKRLNLAPKSFHFLRNPSHCFLQFLLQQIVEYFQKAYSILVSIPLSLEFFYCPQNIHILLSSLLQQTVSPFLHLFVTNSNKGFQKTCNLPQLLQTNIDYFCYWAQSQSLFDIDKYFLNL
jgi:hypothetical protein